MPDDLLFPKGSYPKVICTDLSDKTPNHFSHKNKQDYHVMSMFTSRVCHLFGGPSTQGCQNQACNMCRWKCSHRTQSTTSKINDHKQCNRSKCCLWKLGNVRIFILDNNDHRQEMKKINSSFTRKGGGNKSNNPDSPYCYSIPFENGIFRFQRSVKPMINPLFSIKFYFHLCKWACISGDNV